jgi:peptide/nickel transport system permease protein
MRRIIKKLRSPFVSFLFKKIVFLLAAFFIAMSFLFIFPHLMPWTPVDIMLGRLQGGESTSISSVAISPGSAQSNLAVMRQIYEAKFGINEPLYIQYIDFWKRIFTMDFGLSYWRYPQPVSGLVVNSLLWTLALILPVIPLGFVIGNWIGSRAAYNRGKLDKLLYYVSLYMFQAPYYWIALIVVFIFGIKLAWFPPFGAYSSGWIKPVLNMDWFLDALYHYILPFLSLLGVGIGGWAIGMRAMTVYEMESDYMQYSKQLGFSRGKLRSYAAHNAILPNFTWIPVALSSLISQTLLVEVVFGYPGLGTLMYQAIYAADYPLIEASFVIIILIVLVGNFFADMLYGVIDPRIATGYVGGK